MAVRKRFELNVRAGAMAAMPFSPQAQPRHGNSSNRLEEIGRDVRARNLIAECPFVLGG